MDKLINRSVQELQKIGKEDNTPFFINLVGYRDVERNAFNDHFVYYYYDEAGKVVGVQIDHFTTDPGTSTLLHPQNVHGCAVLKTGFYPKLWKRGLHKGYPALVQVGNCTVYRDNKKDGKLDLNAPTETGVFGINCHRANPKIESVVVDGWSAGCQVFSNPDQQHTFIELCDLLSPKSGQKLYNYLLVNL